MARPGLFRHRKFVRLARLLGSEALAAGHLEILWHGAYEAGDARLGTSDDLEYLARWQGDPGRLTAALAEAGFVDALDGGTYAVHDLLDHAPTYVADRARKEQARREDRTCEHCGGAFHSAETHARYCSPNCRQAAYRARRGDSVTQSDEALRNGVTRVTESYGPPSPAQPSPAPLGEESPNPSCPQPACPAAGPAGLLTFPVVGKGPHEWHLDAAKVAELRDAFPDLDVLSECRKARCWIEAMPERRKTGRGMSKFLFGWMSRAQNNRLGPGSGRKVDPPADRRTPAQREAQRQADRDKAAADREQAALPSEAQRAAIRRLAGHVGQAVETNGAPA